MKTLALQHLTATRQRRGLITLTQRGYLFSGKQEPIKFETVKTLPYSQENFYKVIQDVDSYQLFIPWITSSKVFKNTVGEKQENLIKKGKFDAETKIGFSALSFAYVSHVSYEEPYSVLSESYNSRIFESLNSHWRLEKVKKHECRVHYKISMTFTSSLYTSITNQFFDFLAKNINKSFEERCYKLYYKDKVIDNNEEPASLISLEPSLTQQEEIKAKRMYMPDDLWLWDLHHKHQPTVKEEGLKAMENGKGMREWKKVLVKSVQELQQHGYLKDLEISKVKSALESSDNLMRDLKMLYETFGQDQTVRQVYARHMYKILVKVAK